MTEIDKVHGGDSVVHKEDDAAVSTAASLLLLKTIPPTDDCALQRHGIDEPRSERQRVVNDDDDDDAFDRRPVKRRKLQLPLASKRRPQHTTTTLAASVEQSAAVVAGATGNSPPSTKTMEGTAKRGMAAAPTREHAQTRLHDDAEPAIPGLAKRNAPNQVSLSDLDDDDNDDNDSDSETQEQKQPSASLSELPPVREHDDDGGDKSTPQEAHQQQQQQQQLSEWTANPQNVYFGWIRHEGTKNWREAVKSFSQNRKEYPSWSDEIGQQVIDMLRVEKGIQEFYVSRRREGVPATGNHAMTTTGPSSSSSASRLLESKKLFDKNKKKVGTWSLATVQEVIDRTKQRFIDDRKPQVVVSGAKRPRGRPPKIISRDTSWVEPDATPITERIRAFLSKFLPPPTETSQQTTSLVPTEKDIAGIQAANGAMLQPVITNPTELLAYLAMMRELETLQMQLRERIETKVANAKKEAVANDTSSKTSDDLDNAASPQPLKMSAANGTSSTSIVVPQRKPWFPVMPTNVCFQWNSHDGTVKWCDAVTTFSGDSIRFPEWSDDIADQVRQLLAKDDCFIFLVFLDRLGNECASIHEGLWYLATDKDILEKTKERFIADRQELCQRAE